MNEKLERLKAILSDMGSALVAYSGGADSTLLASVAHEVLSERAVAAIAISPTYPPGEREEAEGLGRAIGIRIILVPTDQMSDPNFVANDARRCYHCRTELYSKFKAVAQREGLAWVIDGANQDDVSDYRPGRMAAAEHGVRSPLIEAGLTKADVRAISHERGLPTWNKPASPCLSSRLPYGVPVSMDALERIAAAEAYLRGLGLRQLRVRHHRSVARIEVEPDQMALLLQHRDAVTARLKELGYAYVTLDMAGFRSGSLNEVLPPAKRLP